MRGIMAGLRLAVFVFLAYVALCAKVSIDLKNARVLRKIPREFLSLALDTGLIRRHWGGIDWR